MTGGVPSGSSRAGCSFSQPRLTTSGAPRGVGVQADVAQGADGDGGAGRVDGHAAAVGVRDGHHVVHVGKARQNFRLDAPHRVLHGRRHALHGGRDAEHVLRAHAAVRVAVAFEGVACERRQRGRRRGGERQFVERRALGHLHELLAHPGACGDGARRVADHLAVAQDGVALFEIAQRHLVALGNQLRAQEAFGRGGDGHVIPRVDLDGKRRRHVP